MKKVSMILIGLTIIISFVACSNNVKYIEIENKTIVSDDGTEYTFLGNEQFFCCLGKWEFIGHVKGEKKSFTHMISKIKTGMYSVNGSEDVLVRYFPNNEFHAVYVKSELLKTEVTLDNCIRFLFVKDIYSDENTTLSNSGITECQQFLNEIKNEQTAEEARLYDLPDGMSFNRHIYGYVCGVVQEDLNFVICLPVNSFDDEAYSIIIDGTEYVLPQKWLDKMITE